MHQQLINTLSRYRHIPKSDQSLIVDSFNYKSIKSGERLLKAGLVAKQLFFINKGVLRVTVPNLADRDFVYFFMKSGQFMTFLYSMYGNVPAQQGLQAACDAEVLTISLPELELLFVKLPYLRALIDQIAQLSMAEMVTIKNTYLAGEALDKYRLFLEKETEVSGVVSMIDIASYLGITPQSLSRVRRIYAHG